MQHPRSDPSPAVLRLRRMRRLAPPLILTWTVATLLAVRLSGVARLSEISLGETISRSLLVGLIVGLCAAWLEGNVLPRWGRRLPLGVVLVLQTAVYSLVVVTAAATAAGLVWIWNYPPTYTQVSEVDAVLSTWALQGFITILILSSFLINLGSQLYHALGGRMLTALLVGRYRKPVAEERVFMFLDLNDSTALAEALGPLRFTAFKSHFFTDLAGPVRDTDGSIVQYVGDAVMVTWPMRVALKDGAPLRFFFRVEQAIAARAAHYQTHFGAVPKFKAGLHGGKVVTAQVGDLRRDIVHSGDVVNTAARIEGECRPRGRRLLVSAELLERMALPAGLGAEDIGTAPLRGKEDAVRLYSIDRDGS